MNIGLLAVAWTVNCYQGDTTLLDKCEREANVFTYVTQFYRSEDSSILPYRTDLDKSCVEMPESCRAFEAAEELGRILRGE